MLGRVDEAASRDDLAATAVGRAVHCGRRERLSGPRIARRLGLPVSTVGAVLRRLGWAG